MLVFFIHSSKRAPHLQAAHVQEACRCRVTASGGWSSPGAALLGRPRFRGRNIWVRTPQGYLSFRHVQDLSTASFRSCFSLPERGDRMAAKREIRPVTLMFLLAEPAIFRKRGGLGLVAPRPILRRTITQF